MNKIALEVLNVTQGYTQQYSYAVVLGEVDGKRRLPIVIGAIEAQAIIVSYENMPSKRPLTHDLIKNMLDTFHITLKEVLISNIVEGIFYATLVCINDGEEYEIDSRTSDAIALSLRFNCPIFINKDIFDREGIVLMNEYEELLSANPEEEYFENKKSASSSIYHNRSIEELEQLLEETINNEEYEAAVKIRDELNKRKKT